MANTLLKIKCMYNSFGRGEKKIADWILDHPGELIGMSISELATVCGCGDATVVRFSKRLGLSGYQALKINIAQELGSASSGSRGILKEDSCLDIYVKHAADIELTLEKTRAVLSENMLSCAAKVLLNARTILLIGLGSSASIALDAMHKLQRAGLQAYAYSDNHMQMIAASHLTADDAVLAISHSGSSIDIISALEQARKNGASTISITNYGRSPIAGYSDYLLQTNADETKYTILAMSSRIAQLAIIDTLYTYIILHGGQRITEAVQNTERSLENKKY